MEVILTELSKLAIFGIKFILVYVPCFIGSIAGIHYNKVSSENANKTRKKTTAKRMITLAFSSSILPTLIVLTAEILWPEDMQVDDIFKYIIAMVLGFIGADKITEYLKNVHTLLKTLKAISGGIDGLAKLSEEIESEESNSSSEEE